MSYSKTVSNGSARDEALKRRTTSMRRVLGMDAAPQREVAQPAEQTVDEKPSEPPVSLPPV